MNFSKNWNPYNPGFQIAPMIDLAFQLLTFFMVCTVLAEWETKIGITVPVADSGVSAARPPGEIIINIDEAGVIVVNNVEMTQARLEGLLAEVAVTFRDQPVIIRADGKTRHECVIAILDICRKVDIWNVAFATLPRAGTKKSE